MKKPKKEEPDVNEQIKTIVNDSVDWEMTKGLLKEEEYRINARIVRLKKMIEILFAEKEMLNRFPIIREKK